MASQYLIRGYFNHIRLGIHWWNCSRNNPYSQHIKKRRETTISLFQRIISVFCISFYLRRSFSHWFRGKQPPVGDLDGCIGTTDNINMGEEPTTNRIMARKKQPSKKKKKKKKSFREELRDYLSRL